MNIGKCLSFNGVNQEVTIPDHADYSISTTGKLTVLIWFKLNEDPQTNFASSGYVNFFGKNESGNNHEWEMRWYNYNNTETNLRGNEVSFYIFSAAGGLGASVFSQADKYVTSGKWMCAVGVADGQYAKFYLNGQTRSALGARVDYVAYPVTPADTTGILRVARSANNPAYFKGEVGPIKIWNRVLSENEIIRQYTSNESNTAGLVGHWTADESNNRLTDNTATANHGTLVGSPTYTDGEVKSRSTDFYPRSKISTNKAMITNGTSQYASIADASQTGLDVGTDDFMICFRAKISNKANIQTFVAKCSTGYTSVSSAGAVGYDVIYNSTNNALSFRFNDGTTSGSNNYNRAPIFDNEWHNIAMVSARSTAISQVWVDGVKVINGSNTITATYSNDGLFRVGTRRAADSWFLNGGISKLHFYKWTTIPKDYFYAIQDLHWLGKTEYTDGLVSKWLLSADGTDSYGTNDLTLTASPTFSETETAVRSSSSTRTTSSSRTAV